MTHFRTIFLAPELLHQIKAPYSRIATQLGLAAHKNFSFLDSLPPCNRFCILNGPREQSRNYNP